jgi:O-antigen/teichoic acid export membrane protein
MITHPTSPELRTDDRSIWRRSRRNVSISAAGSGLSLAVKFAQTALLAKILKIEDFGRVLIVLNLFVFLDSFLGMRVSDAMFRFFPWFKDREDDRSLKGLLLLCLGLCLASGVLIYGGVFILSPWLSNRFYPGLGLAPLFRIYGCTVLFTSFSGVYEPILRLHDRFSSVVAPQVLGSIVTLALLLIYSLSQPSYTLEAIVAAFAIGVLIQTVPPLIKALRLVRHFLSGPRVNESMRALNEHRPALMASLFNSNLSGYLKLAISPGDIFLLGLFSSPTQLAWYGLAKQLTAPLAFLQTNIQTAVIPEIAALTGEGKFEQLNRLLRRYLVRSSTLSSILLAGVILLGYILIRYVLPPEYASALPVFCLLAIAAWLLLVFLVFRPLALSLDLLKWHNLALLTSTVIVIVVIAAGRLSALTMAVIQMADALVVRSLFSWLVWTRVKRLRSEQ